ncbi:MAG: VWA domain-containing protein [Sandaracinaceae bacterium]|nr:VWA domain-containing protein [Sandaracinaceae bacterium]
MALSHTAQAQVLPDDLPADTDPLGGDDEAVGHALDARVADDAAARANFGPPAPVREVRAGAVLTAIASVREVEHRDEVVLNGGLATVRVSMRFSNSSGTPAEVLYRLSVPAGANLDSLEACDGERCRAGIAEAARADGLSAYDDAVRARGPGGETLPVAHAVVVRGSSGDRIDVRAAPVVQHRDIVVRVTYTADARMYGGVVHMQLPARGQDPRTAPSQVSLTAPEMIALSIDGQPAATFHSRIEAWYPVALVAMSATRAPVVTHLMADWRGRPDCTRVRVSAGPRPAEPADIVLLIDASPSTEGPARGRIAPAIAAILSNAPSGSTVRAVAFGAHAEVVLGERQGVENASIVPLAQAALMSLGSSTRLESAWARARAWAHEPLSQRATRRLVILVGDGAISEGRDATRAITEIQRSRVAFNVVNVADRDTSATLLDLVNTTRGVSVQAGAVADLVVQGRDESQLSARLSALFAATVVEDVVVGYRGIPHLGRLRAGEELSWQGCTQARRGTRTRGGGARALGQRIQGSAAPQALVAVSAADAEARVDSASCDPRGPALRAGGVNTDAAPIALVSVRACVDPMRAAPAAPPTRANLEGRGIPAETVLSMLRTRIIPSARGCFRQDRRGRGDYSARAIYTFTLADREVVSVDIDGTIAEPLRLCLRDAIDTLDVPRFSGTVVVRYPIRTEAAEPEPTLELAPEVAREIDAHFHDAEGVNSLR